MGSLGHQVQQREEAAVVWWGIWESSQHQEKPPLGLGIRERGKGSPSMSLMPGDFSQVDEAVAVLQAHHAKKEAAQKVGAVAAATS